MILRLKLITIAMASVVYATPTIHNSVQKSSLGSDDQLSVDPFFNEYLTRSGMAKKHNLLITDVLPMDNGVHYAKALDVKKEIYNTKSVLITCGNDSNKNYKNRVLSVYKAFAEKTIDPKHPNASSKKFIVMPSLNFKVENGQCYVTSTRCDTKLKDIPRLFSSKTTKPYSPLFGDIISDIANGMGYLRALGWLYNMDLNGK